MATLCVDTATQHAVVVVARDGRPPASSRWRSSGRHGENLFRHIETAMNEAGVARSDLSRIGVAVGPGGFTSLRVGLATAKGIALALSLPIIGVSSLRVLARSIPREDDVVRIPLMNAYRGDVFAAAYRITSDAVESVVEPFYSSPADALAAVERAAGTAPVAFRGEGVAPHRSLIESVFGQRVELDEGLERPCSNALLEEVRFVAHVDGPADLDTLEPIYLRASDARLPASPLRTV